jgi:carbonic anhydrase
MKSLLFLPLIAVAWNYAMLGQDWDGTCQTGERQSPINIATGDCEVLDNNYRLEIYYFGKTTSRVMANSGNLIYMEGDFGYIVVIDNDGNERKFLSEWIEFHMPSEHWFDDYPADMELQVFHRIEDSYSTTDFPTRAVVSVPIRPGDESFFMNSVDVYNLPSAGQNNSLDYPYTINLMSIMTQDDEYFFYKGSLNKPTCDEDVLWFVFESQAWVSLSQMENFKKLWIEDERFSGGRGNVREIQKTNGRTVYYSAALRLVGLVGVVGWLV